jgi:nucleoside-diphosphate-sugar epimerase
MVLAVTGANGFIGQYVVARALARGHTVRALERTGSGAVRNQVDVPALHRVIGDLRDPDVADRLVKHVDSIVHLACADTSRPDPVAETVETTNILLQASLNRRIGHFVHISSFAVYDYRRLNSYEMLDEESPTEGDPTQRDAYCRMKLVQERLVMDRAGNRGLACSVLRPGMVYGPGRLWSGRLGTKVRPNWWIATGSRAPLPIISVRNCAEAIVRVTERAPRTSPEVLNLIEGPTPTQREYVQLLRSQQSHPVAVLTMPWWSLRTAAATTSFLNRTVFRDRLRVPSLLRPGNLHARCKPLSYSNGRLTDALGWTPDTEWENAVACYSRGKSDDDAALAQTDIQGDAE